MKKVSEKHLSITLKSLENVCLREMKMNFELIYILFLKYNNDLLFKRLQVKNLFLSSFFFKMEITATETYNPKSALNLNADQYQNTF